MGSWYSYRLIQWFSDSSQGTAYGSWNDLIRNIYSTWLGCLCLESLITIFLLNLSNALVCNSNSRSLYLVSMRFVTNISEVSFFLIQYLTKAFKSDPCNFIVFVGGESAIVLHSKCLLFLKIDPPELGPWQPFDLIFPAAMLSIKCLHSK